MKQTEKKEYLKKFTEIYGEGGSITAFFAPGRVNLIGEHTDYNGGRVFPCALTLGTTGLIRRRDDRMLRFLSLTHESEGILTASLDGLDCSPEHSWIDYPIGVIKVLEENGYCLPQGADILIAGTLPEGSGLSSSASLEVLTGLMLRNTFGFAKDITPIDLAKMAQTAENKFIGYKCGIMDQFTSVMGRRDSAIFLNTNTLHFQYVPLALKNMSLVIVNSNVRHYDAADIFRQRQDECALALHDLKKVLPLNHLCDILGEQFEEYRTCIHDPTARKRARHVIYENQRTIQASSALVSGNLTRFGLLMKQSHESLRDNFEVTTPELDFLAELAWAQPSCIGSRMTGAGSGGCTVSIVRDEGLEDFRHVLESSYEKEFGKNADFYAAGVGDGARELSMA